MNDPDGMGAGAPDPSALYAALGAAHDGDATRALEELCHEYKNRIETHTAQLDGYDPSDEQWTYTKGRLDEAQSALVILKTVGMGLIAEDMDGGDE